MYKYALIKNHNIVGYREYKEPLPPKTFTKKGPDGLPIVRPIKEFPKPINVNAIYTYLEQVDFIKPYVVERKWFVRPIDITKLAAVIREQRDQFLFESDWTQLPDAPLTPSQKEKWIEYRQLLRQVPEQNAFPYKVYWPSKPPL